MTEPTVAFNFKKESMNYVEYDTLDQASDRQKRWFYRYFENGCNASEAAEYVGYANAQQSGWECKRRFRKLIAVEFRHLQLAKDQALFNLGEMASSSMADFIQIEKGESGFYHQTDEGTEYLGHELVKLNLEHAKRQGKLHLIKKIKIGKDNQVTLELYDKLKASHLIAKGYGASEEENELEGAKQIADAIKEARD